MPKIDTSDLEQHQLPTGSFGYSATRLDELGATEYTLVDLVVDISTSVRRFESEMENCIREVINACRLSPRADNLMLRIVLFNTSVQELHGYKLLEQCNPDDYHQCLNAGGNTALFDAAENSIAAQGDYGKQLTDADFAVNGIVIVITDGEDNSSTLPATSTKSIIDNILDTEPAVLESLITILVGVGTASGDARASQLKKYLQEFKDQGGLDQFVPLEEGSSKTLAKLAAFVSKSISAQSQALGSGGPSTLVSLDV